MKTDETRPINQVALAGGVAGTIADACLHSVDTLKTRIQGQLTAQSTKYKRVLPALGIIVREEGYLGLYGGFTAMSIGAILSHTAYFGCYESLKRKMLNNDFSPSLTYFLSGGIADVFASFFYVPSEV